MTTHPRSTPSSGLSSQAILLLTVIAGGVALTIFFLLPGRTPTRAAETRVAAAQEPVKAPAAEVDLIPTAAVVNEVKAPEVAAVVVQTPEGDGAAVSEQPTKRKRGLKRGKPKPGYVPNITAKGMVSEFREYAGLPDKGKARREKARAEKAAAAARASAAGEPVETVTEPEEASPAPSRTLYQRRKNKKKG